MITIDDIFTAFLLDLFAIAFSNLKKKLLKNFENDLTEVPDRSDL